MSAKSLIGSRIEPITAALVFAVTFMVGIFTMTTPQFDAPDAAWIAFWDDRSHRILEIVGAFSLLSAGGALVWFATVLARRVGSRLLVSAAWASAVMLWVGAVLVSAIPAAMSISRAPAFHADIARITVDMGAAAVVMYATPVAALILLVTAIAGRRTDTLPGWLCWAGMAVAVILLGLGDAFFVLPLLPLWVIAAGGVLSGQGIADRPVGGVVSAAG